MTPEEKENALRAQARRCAEEITKAMSVKPKPKWNAVCPPHPSQALREGKADGYQPGEICQRYWPHEWAVWSGTMKVEKSDVLAFTISDVERLDPVRVMIENYEPGKGRITVTCYGQAWTGAWFAMGGDTVQAFIKRVSNDYLIGCLAPRLESSVDDDNDANLEFVKSQIIKLRREQEIDRGDAREMWTEAENAEDVKANCCDFIVGDKLLNLFGDDPWYAGWPSVPNPKYQYLDRILNAVRIGLVEMERAA